MSVDRDRHAIAAVLERHLRDIVLTGALVKRREPGRNPGWRVRFRVKEAGQTRHRSISLGDDPEVAQTVTGIIDQGREMKQRRREKRGLGIKRKRRSRQLVKSISSTVRGSRRHRQAVRKLVRAYALGEADPDPSVAAYLSSLVPKKSRGRPYVCRIW